MKPNNKFGFIFIVASALAILPSCSIIANLDGYVPSIEGSKLHATSSYLFDTLSIGNLRINACPISLHHGSMYDAAVMIGPPLLPIIPKTPATIIPDFPFIFYCYHDSVEADFSKAKLTLVDGRIFIPDSVKIGSDSMIVITNKTYIYNHETWINLWFAPSLRDAKEFTLNLNEVFTNNSPIPLIRYRKENNYYYIPIIVPSAKD
jgi:hypothetical protein